MKKINFLKLIPLLLVMPLIICGCDENSASNDIIKMGSTDQSHSIIEKYSSFKSENFLNEGVINLRAGNVQKAVEILEEFTKYYPQNPVGQFYLGKAYYKNNMYKEAIFPLKSALKLDKSMSEAFLYLGYSYKKLGNRKKATEELFHYIVNEPDNKNVEAIKEEINDMAGPVIGKDIIGRIFITDEIMKEKNLALKSTACFDTTIEEIYASLEIIDAPYNSEIEIKWLYVLPENKTMNVNTARLSAEGSKNALISLKKPSSDWPAGKYKLEILVDNEKNSSLYFYIF